MDVDSTNPVSLHLRAAPYLMCFVFPALVLASLYFRGITTWFGIIYGFIILPILELILPRDGWNPSKTESKELEHCISYRVITWLYTPVPLALALYCTYFAISQDLSVLEWTGIALSCALCTGGVGITVAHELMHKQNKFEQFLSKVILISTFYNHFFIEHLHGHHKRVATAEDPATARFDESLYAFVPRSVVGSWISAWHLEAKRLQKKALPLYSYHNQMLQYVAVSIALCVSIFSIWGAYGLAFFLVQAVVGFTLLEVVNYIEHYGLERELLSEDEQGKRYQRVNPMHSWNADHVASNYVLFKLQRHADHHTWPTRRYQTLRSWDYSPQLPTGYTGMMLLALVPPLWRFVMNHRVVSYREYTDSQHAEAQAEPLPHPIVGLVGERNLHVLTEAAAPLLWIPAALKETYDIFVPSLDIVHFFPSVSFDFLTPYVSPAVLARVKRTWRYLTIKFAQLLNYTGSVIGWIGAQLGASGGALLLVRLGIHLNALAESLLLKKRPARREQCSDSWRSNSSPAILLPRARSSSSLRSRSSLACAVAPL